MDEQKPKKAYTTPQLIVYGDVRQLTQGAFATGKADAGKGKSGG